MFSSTYRVMEANHLNSPTDDHKFGALTPRKSVLVALLTMLFILPLIPIHAQEPPDNVLTPVQPVSGSISDAAPQQEWTFDAKAGQTISLRMQITSGDLDPLLELVDGRGNVLAQGKHASLSSVAVQAAAITETATYTVRVGRNGGSASQGDYRLWLLPGYSFLLINDPMDLETPLRSWREPNASSRVAQGKLRLALEANNNFTWTTADALGNYQDVYLQTKVQLENYNAYWEYGLLLRGKRDGNVAEFYMLMVNSRGEWRMTASLRDGLRVISDWTAMPTTAKILPLSNSIAVLAQGDTFTLYFNDVRVGRVTDDTLPDAGLIGVAVATSVRPDNIVAALFDDYLVTVPAPLTDQPATAPATLENWNGSSETILAELVQAGVIPSGGKPGFSLPTAYVSNNTGGSIIFVTLMDGLDYADMIYAADVVWDSDSENIACALEFRVQDGANFSIIYFDRKGGYGVRQIAGTELPIAQEYALTEAIKKENQASNRVLVIALGNRLLLYINGQLVSNAFVRQVSGSILLAAYNYERASTYCGFNNVWLRSFN
ncbi:MAG: hypothetical protein KF726_13660 [Anaerolineae bacterium]|nr:hypothetical protein [Anaerolineae bacterium]